MSPEDVWIGSDVAKAWLDVARSGEARVQRFANDAEGVAALVAALMEPPPHLVVLEATGGDETLAAAALAAAALAAAGLPVAVVNPRQVRDFATATGRLAKTDALDAQLVALFAARIQPPVRPVPEAVTEAVASLLARRRQLLQLRTAEKNRRPTLAARLHPGLDEHLRVLERQIGALDAELERTVRDSPLWREKAALLRSIPGIGPMVSATLLGGVPELGTLDRGEVAALAGVAPLNCDRGARTGTRHIWGGRAPVRTARSMAVISGIRGNPIIRVLYHRLHKQGGKPKKVAIVACMRKLLTIANAVLRDGAPWRPRVATAV